MIKENRCTCHGKRIRGHGARWPKDLRIRRHEDLTKSRWILNRKDADPYVVDYVTKVRQRKVDEATIKDLAVLEDIYQRVQKVHTRQQLSPLFVGGIDTKRWPGSVFSRRDFIRRLSR